MIAAEAPRHIRSPISGTDTISLRGDCYGYTFDRIVGTTLPRLSLTDVGWPSAHVDGQLVFSLAEIHDMSEETIGRPFDERNFHDHLRAHPMHPREHQR